MEDREQSHFPVPPDAAEPGVEAHADEHRQLVADAATAVGVALSPLWGALLAELVKRLDERRRDRGRK
jgi:hypothetical protein